MFVLEEPLEPTLYILVQDETYSFAPSSVGQMEHKIESTNGIETFGIQISTVSKPGCLIQLTTNGDLQANGSCVKGNCSEETCSLAQDLMVSAGMIIGVDVLYKDNIMWNYRVTTGK